MIRKTASITVTYIMQNFATAHFGLRNVRVQFFQKNAENVQMYGFLKIALVVLTVLAA